VAQPDEPVEFVYVPVAQALQLAAPDPEYVPTAQGEQTVSVVAVHDVDAYEPAEHCAQEAQGDTPLAENVVPATHGTITSHCALRLFHAFPDAQKHCVAPTDVELVLYEAVEGHCTQLVVSLTLVE
jgi:hypothetical protein